MQSIPSPFLSDELSLAREPDDSPLVGDVIDSFAALSPMEAAPLRKELQRMREVFPERSQFAVIDLDCCMLLAVQLSSSELQGFDVMVLMFLLANFDHKYPVIHLTLSELARQLDRNVSQVRRSMRKLEKLSWARFNRRGLIQLSPVIMRSANKKYRAIHFRHAASPFRRPS
jgi:hypothetical protein